MAKALKAKDLREKTPEDLKQELLAVQRELFNLRMQYSAQPMPNHSELGRAKRDVARILTILKEKESQS